MIKSLQLPILVLLNPHAISFVTFYSYKNFLQSLNLITQTLKHQLDLHWPSIKLTADTYFLTSTWRPKTFMYKPKIFDFFSRKLVKAKLNSPWSNITLFYYLKRDHLFVRRGSNTLNMRVAAISSFSRKKYFKKKNFKITFTTKTKRRHLFKSTFLNMKFFKSYKKTRHIRTEFVANKIHRLSNKKLRLFAGTTVPSWYFDSPRKKRTAANSPKIYTVKLHYRPMATQWDIKSNTLSAGVLYKKISTNETFKLPRFSSHKLFPLDVSRTNFILINRFIRAFRLNTSALFKYTPIRRQIIQYNLTRIYRPFESMKMRLIINKSNNQIHNLKRKASVLNSSPYQTLKRKRRVRTLWMAYVTRLMITPQRHEFMLLYRKRFLYQKKVSRYVLKFYRFKVLEAVQNYEFNIILFLVRSWFALTPKIAENLINAGVVYINGVRITSKSITLFGGDILQLVVQRSYFLFHRWSSIFYRLRLSKFRYFANFWRLRGMRPYPKDTSRRIPHWIIYYKIIIEEVPFYIELDFTSLSALLLKAYVNNPAYYHYFSLRETPFAAIRMYNWKSFV